MASKKRKAHASPKTRKAGTITIQKGIKVPPRRGGRAQKGYAAALRSMAVGESFFMPGGSSSTAWGNIKGLKEKVKKFATRREKGGVRVWRIK